MILGIMSDTHGNRKLMHRVADSMEEQLGVELIFHLGDDYGDGEELQLYGHNVKTVPGLWCAEYGTGRAPKCLVEEIDGITIVCAHAEKDVRLPRQGASVILTGHTHRARIELIGPTLHVNPGHLKATNNQKEPASFATLTLDAEEIHAAIHDATGGVWLERTVPRHCLV